MIISNQAVRHRVVRTAARAILILWAGFWMWFVLVHVFADGISSLYHGSKILVPMLTAIVTAWYWPRVGGVLLIAFGIALVFYFNIKGFRFVIDPLAMPLMVCGLLLVLFGRKSLANRVNSPDP
ncbi:MAG: hypothetical protein JSV03_01910 [Planctomycetota bacterium]|nr:MAG: hypothetical protein JSV03_01910 [Planctomycetota bacterium]